MPPARKRVREPHQLPPGRHGLSRSFVASNQRERILAAVADVTSLVGYPSMRVEDIIATAGVSRRTFYDHFRDKEEAFLAAYDAGVARILGMLQEAIAAHETFSAQVRAGLAAYLEFAASEPELSDLCVVEVLAAGPKAIERRNAAMRTSAAILHAVAKAGADPAPPLVVAEVIVGGVYEVIYSRLLAGEAAGLPQLHHDLAYSVMLPYLGPEAAKREAAEPPVTVSGSGSV